MELSEKWEDFAWYESSTELGVGFRFYWLFGFVALLDTRELDDVLVV